MVGSIAMSTTQPDFRSVLKVDSQLQAESTIDGDVTTGDVRSAF
jgi:hypothetical protein